MRFSVGIVIFFTSLLTLYNISITRGLTTDSNNFIAFFQNGTDIVRTDIVESKAAICAIVLEEDAYIQEWVDYHLGLGFDFIYIFDNSENFDLKGWGAEQQTEQVRVIHFPGLVKQNEAYRNCSSELFTLGYHKWVAFFDLDEFLVLRRHKTVSSFLNKFLKSGGLGINWIHMGSSNRQIYEPIPVTLRFQYKMGNRTNIHIKSIAVLNDINFGGKFHCHFPPIKKRFKIVDTNGKRIRGPFNRNGPQDIASLYHFFSKSKKEFYSKRVRGRADTIKYDKDYFTAINESLSGWFPGDTFDNSVWLTLTRNAPKYKIYERFN
jgi:Glycosyl transferase family 2